MILADTSAVVQITRDKSGLLLANLESRFPGETLAMTPLTELEIFRGARDERNWRRLEGFLSGWPRVEFQPEDWKAAARITVDARKRGLTFIDPVDCCNAHVALSRNLPLLHRDRDFESMLAVCEGLSLIWLD